jgi:maleate cis-trans isomerase
LKTVNRKTGPASATNKVGFISPPGWFDISPTEFLRVAPDNTIVSQTIMRKSGFDYSLDSFRTSMNELKDCYYSLRNAGAHVVAQFGYPFSLVHGWQGACRIQKNIQSGNSDTLVMMGTEIIYAIRQLNCQRVSVASTYYSDKMSQLLNKYLSEAGLNVVTSSNWQEQGLATDDGQTTFIGQGELDPMDWQTPSEAVKKAIRHTAASGSSGECILVTGGGMRLLDIAEEMELELGKPVIGGDLALYWGILRRLPRRHSVHGHGRLLACIA